MMKRKTKSKRVTVKDLDAKIERLSEIVNVLTLEITKLGIKLNAVKTVNEPINPYILPRYTL